MNDLATRIKECFKNNPNSKVIIIGGTDDLNHAVNKAASELYESFDLVRVDPQLDVKPLHKKEFKDEEPTY